MRVYDRILGPAFTVVGLLFAFNSAGSSFGAGTHWGYALTGITCIVVGAMLLGLRPGADHAWPGKGKPSPLD